MGFEVIMLRAATFRPSLPKVPKVQGDETLRVFFDRQAELPYASTLQQYTTSVSLALFTILVLTRGMLEINFKAVI